MRPSSFRSSRPHDITYDPNFLVSGPKDHYKQLIQSKIETAKYAICPIYATMFSELRNYPRKQYIMRKTAPMPQYVDKIGDNKAVLFKTVDVTGSDRHKYFSHAPTATIPHLNLANTQIKRTPSITMEKTPRIKINFKTHANKHMQTMYRESSAQTSPWEPDYKVVAGDPQLLKLDFLKWGAGLPAGVHEVELIQRARMKRKWEESLPSDGGAKGLAQRSELIEALERNEWAFREQEIQDIQDLRLQLLEEMLNELHVQSKKRTEIKMNMFCKMKCIERDDKLKKLKKNSNREKRRLTFQHKGILAKYHSVNVVVEHLDYKSELYAPLIRNGNNPKYRHTVISDHMKNKNYTTQYEDIKKYSTLPNWLPHATDLKDCQKLPGTRLCIKQTKWTTPVLKSLYEELKKLRDRKKVKVNLRVPIKKAEERIKTPEVLQDYDEDEDMNAAAVVLQSVLRGRAAQIVIYQGRDRCRELIEELRSNYSFMFGASEIASEKRETKFQQRDENNCLHSMAKLEASLKSLGGTVVGTLLDFLNKELVRLLEERKTHALGLIIERERQQREAAEAGRRQYELRRRQEHDEIFKQTIKMHQDTVDLYLQDIIAEGMEFSSEQEASAYVTLMAAKVDEETLDKTRIDDILYEDEYIANLVHHFVIPEVEKEIVRNKRIQQQKKFMRTAHEEIYNTIEELPKPGSVTAEEETLSETSCLDEKFKFEEDLQQYIEFVKHDDGDEGNIIDVKSEVQLIAPSPSADNNVDYRGTKSSMNIVSFSKSTIKMDPMSSVTSMKSFDMNND